MLKIRPSDDTLINLAAILAIVIVAIAALIVTAGSPDRADSVNVLAVGGITAIAGFLRRPQATSNGTQQKS